MTPPDGGSSVAAVTPVAVAGGMLFTALSAGSFHTCGIVSAGVYCWGLNSAGQLGADSANALSTTPALVQGDFTFESVSAGAAHTCGLSAKVARCWGDNILGQLGTGSTRPITQPSTVVTSP